VTSSVIRHALDSFVGDRGDRLPRDVGVPVARYLQPNRSDIGKHRVRAVAVAGIATVAAGRVVLVIAQVVGQFAVQRGLQYPLRQ